MVQGHKAADNSSILPATAREVQDSFDNFAALGAAGENGAIGCEGFLRLTTEELYQNSIAVIQRVMFQGDRFVLQQAGEDIAAVIPEAEFNRLSCLMDELKPSQFFPDEEEYYEDDFGIHCIHPEELLEAFDNILACVCQEGELFGLLPTEEMGEDVDVFMPVAILMSADRFWVSEYMMAEKKSRK